LASHYDELAKPVPCHIPVNSLRNNEGKSVVKVGRRHAGKVGVGVIAPRMRTQKIIDEASHWRDQAENTRSAAEHFIDPKSKRTMLGIAETYEHLAVRAEQRAAKDPSKSASCKRRTQG